MILIYIVKDINIDWYEKTLLRWWDFSQYRPGGNTCTSSLLSAQKAAHCTWKRPPVPHQIWSVKWDWSKVKERNSTEPKHCCISSNSCLQDFCGGWSKKGQSFETIEKGQIFERFMEHNALVCAIYWNGKRLAFNLLSSSSRLYLPQNLFLLPHQPCGYVRVCLENWPHLKSMLEVHSK